MTNTYFNFPFKKALSDLKQVLNDRGSNTKDINMYIDLNSINKSFFNIDTVLLELRDDFKSLIMVKDLVKLLKRISEEFSESDVRFMIYYDEGGSIQNKSIDPEYKANRKNFLDNYIVKGVITEEDKKRYGEIRKQYFKFINEKFFSSNKVSNVSLGNYEADLVAHYCIVNNLIRPEKNPTNIIFSADKDLLQTVYLPNTYQITISYFSSKKAWEHNIWDNENALQKLNKKYDFNKYKLGADYIPLVLAMAGDDADNVKNLYRGMGEVTALNMIKSYEIPSVITEETHFPEPLRPYKDKLILNFKLTSFDEQIKRIPEEILEVIKQRALILNGD
jgi:hypothetical protein